MLGVAFFGSDGIPEVRRLQRESDDLKAEIKELEDRQTTLSDEASLLTDDKEAIERRAREEFGMVREGETVILLREKGVK